MRIAVHGDLISVPKKPNIKGVLFQKRFGENQGTVILNCKCKP